MIQIFQIKNRFGRKEGEELQGILDADPKLSVCGFYTKAIYDFQKETYSAFSNEKALLLPENGRYREIG